MKFVVFGSTSRVGLLVDDRVLDLDRASEIYGTDRSMFYSLHALIESGERGLDRVREVAQKLAGSDLPGLYVDVAVAQLQAPFPGQRFGLAGSNNPDHVANALINRGQDITAEQVRNKTRQGRAGGFWAVVPPVGPGAEVQIPSSANGLFDYEAEVAIVLGKGGKAIKADDWQDHVWGSTLIIDWSVRTDDLALVKKPWYGHKTFDGSKSVGPWIAVDEIDAACVDVETHVNGELRQKFNTRDMIHSYAELLEQMSQDITLRAGDLLAGGTGPGTAIDSTVVSAPGPISRDLFLKPGDAVSVSAPELGTLTANIVGS